MSLCTGILADLVALDTTSRNPNLELIGWIERYLADHGVAAERLPGPDGTKAGLVARIGPEAPGGVVLCGHTDTVPVDGQPWTSDPFRLTAVGDWLVGRGSVDMKGFIACALAVVPDLLAADLQAPVWLGLTYDEEVGCLGAPPLAARLAAERCPPALAIIGEPTDMAAVGAHKGVRVLRTTVVGRDAHSSQPQLGANAIVAAARVVARIEACAADRQAHGPRAEGFSPPHTTMNVGTIAGGTALNIVARECTLVWEFRSVPGEDTDALLARVTDHVDGEITPWLRARHAEAAITTEVVAEVPPLDPRANAAAVAEIVRITGAPAGPPVAYGSDGGALQQAGIPCVVIGPGATDQMHQPDESVTTASLADCDRALGRLVTDLTRR